ncbi:MAG TPA: hypothetical protein VD948_08805 [Rhodothermales bacterium]|nr:hypothetical protein [Rhodothermales bacterium]
MAATRDDIATWLERGKQEGASHMIVVCDTWDHEDFPVFVAPGESVRERLSEYANPSAMSRVMEVYSFALPIEGQLSERRAWHPD